MYKSFAFPAQDVARILAAPDADKPSLILEFVNKAAAGFNYQPTNRATPRIITHCRNAHEAASICASSGAPAGRPHNMELAALIYEEFRDSKATAYKLRSHRLILRPTSVALSTFSRPAALLVRNRVANILVLQPRKREGHPLTETAFGFWAWLTRRPFLSTEYEPIPATFLDASAGANNQRIIRLIEPGEYPEIQNSRAVAEIAKFFAAFDDVMPLFKERKRPQRQPSDEERFPLFRFL